MPARLDRLPWSNFHWRVATALGSLAAIGVVAPWLFATLIGDGSDRGHVFRARWPAR